MVETDLSIFKTVFYYSIAVLLLPIAAFFSTKILLFDGKSRGVPPFLINFILI